MHKKRNIREKLNYLLQSGRRRILRYRSKVASVLNTVPHRIAARDESRRAHAGTIADLFASIMCQVVDIGVDKLDTAMDILRHDFPNVEHIWLAERFQKAYEAAFPLPATLALAAAGRTEEERISLALEVYALLLRIGGDLTSPTLFEEVTYGLNLPGVATMLENLMRTPSAQAPKPLESIAFSSTPGKNTVVLPADEEDVSFRAIRCVNFLLIVNDSDSPISVRGQTLGKGGVLPLSSRQTVELSSCYFSYRTIVALLQTCYTGVRLVNYFSLDGERLSMTRQRLRNSIARVSMGLDVEIEVLRPDTDFSLDGSMLKMGFPVTSSYFTPFHVNGKGPFTFVDLADMDTSGSSYLLDPGDRKVLVTNLPYMNRPDVLKLTPGLAPGVVLEVNYSRSSNTGTVRVLEGTSHSVSVNDIPVRGEDVPVLDGDLIALSAVQFLRCRFSSGVIEEESNVISTLTVRGLTRDFVRAGRVVDNIDFTLRRGEMACILGPSGSGKSTLLSMLAGHLAPSFGSIYYNNERLTTRSENLRRHIAFIPREDILDEAMTVGEHVYQASVARRPRLAHSDRMRRVATVLNFVGIGHLADRSVGRAGERTISDGERTRLNLGLDLTGTSEVFLIDEPISGLSSADAERVIETLENMSEGRILLCTLHRPAQVLLNRFKKVMVLDTHGQMAFWGSPQEMVSYFRNAARELRLRIPREAIAAGGADYVFEVLDAPFRRVGSRYRENPNLWQERFEKMSYTGKSAEQSLPEPENTPRGIPRLSPRTPQELWRLFQLWVSRTLLARVRSRLGLYAMLLEGPVLAVLIAGTLRASSEAPYTFYKSLHITEYLFLSLVLAMFFGLTDAACEILRDRPLLRRESNYKLFTGGYLAAKVLVLTSIAGVQCALYLLVGNAILGIHYMFWDHFAVMLLTAFVGIALSLMVSAFVRQDRTALNIVPLLLVPQILLAGALVRFEEMNEFSPRLPQGIIPATIDKKLSNLRHRVAYQDEITHAITSKPVPLIAEFCPLRYAFEMLFVVQTTNNLWESKTGQVSRLRDQLKENGSIEELRFIQRAALAFNGMASNVYEAKEILRKVNKAAMKRNEAFLEDVLTDQDERVQTEHDQPAEFYFSNRKLTAMTEGVKTARKDGRTNEFRGFFLSPHQARPFGQLDHETDENSIPTVARNAVYLFIMGLVPILLAGWGLRRICRGK